MKFTSVAGLLVATLASTAATEGINCHGSGQCTTLAGNIAKEIVGYINNVDPNRWYANGEHVACSGFICAFLQGTGGAWGRNIKGLAHYIPDHGCRVCGSVPYYYPGDNDISKGMLTINAASGDCTTKQGLC